MVMPGYCPVSLALFTHASRSEFCLSANTLAVTSKSAPTSRGSPKQDRVFHVVADVSAAPPPCGHQSANPFRYARSQSFEPPGICTAVPVTSSGEETCCPGTGCVIRTAQPLPAVCANDEFTTKGYAASTLAICPTVPFLVILPMAFTWKDFRKNSMPWFFPQSNDCLATIDTTYLTIRDGPLASHDPQPMERVLFGIWDADLEALGQFKSMVCGRCDAGIWNRIGGEVMCDGHAKTS